MDERLRAEEHLRVIRSLMERATVYRAISAPTAVFGSAMSFITSAALLLARNDRSSTSLFSLTNPGAARHFIIIWVVVLLATLLANTFFIWRKTRREGSAFMTSGLRLAIYSALPVLIVAAVLTSLFWRDDETAEALPVLVIVWMTCYGLALLATANFAPRSLRFLGWAFLLTGVGCVLLTGRLFNADPARNSVIAMALTFGLYHLVYGVWTWPRKPEAA
jgi:predicted membrane channel-forming protein YqfA (hemolysin III family)